MMKLEQGSLIKSQEIGSENNECKSGESGSLYPLFSRGASHDPLQSPHHHYLPAPFPQVLLPITLWCFRKYVVLLRWQIQCIPVKQNV